MRNCQSCWLLWRLQLLTVSWSLVTWTVLAVTRSQSALGSLTRSTQSGYNSTYTNQLDVAEFESRLRVTAPKPTADGFAEQMERVIVAVLGDMAPLQTCRRWHSKAVTKRLSSEAIETTSQTKVAYYRSWTGSCAAPSGVSSCYKATEQFSSAVFSRTTTVCW